MFKNYLTRSKVFRPKSRSLLEEEKHTRARQEAAASIFGIKTWRYFQYDCLKKQITKTINKMK